MISNKHGRQKLLLFSYHDALQRCESEGVSGDIIYVYLKKIELFNLKEEEEEPSETE